MLPALHQTELTPGYPVVEIRHPAARARVALHGAHLMEWEPANGPGGPVLYLSPQAVYREGRPIRGGVPVCWPWFGPHPSDPALPAHGFARSRFWTLEKTEEHADGVRLHFSLTDDPATRHFWPHSFRLELTMEIGRRLHLSLRMLNTGASGSFTITGALHTYLRTGDIHRTTVGGLEGCTYRDAAAAGAVRRQEGIITFTEETDRDFLHPAPASVRVRDAALNRLITLASTGSGSTVVWNPSPAKAAGMMDLPPGAWEEFVCVETANAWKDQITVPAGGSHLLTAGIAVRSLSPATVDA